jgi:hypothetical protein
MPPSLLPLPNLISLSFLSPFFLLSDLSSGWMWRELERRRALAGLNMLPRGDIGAS